MQVIPLLSTAYLPPVSYFSVMRRYGCARIERMENFQKQSYRTRTRIASAEGVQVLSVPILKGEGHHRPISEIEIDYKRDWVTVHKRALDSYYNSAPYFEYYKDDIFSVLDSRPSLLIDLNTRLTELLLELLGIRCELSFTDEYEMSRARQCDFRELIHPKKPSVCDTKEYYQVFSARTGFIPDLSAVDLLFNEGPNSISFL